MFVALVRCSQHRRGPFVLQRTNVGCRYGMYNAAVTVGALGEVMQRLVNLHFEDAARASSRSQVGMRVVNQQVTGLFKQSSVPIGFAHRCGKLAQNRNSHPPIIVCRLGGHDASAS